MHRPHNSKESILANSPHKHGKVGPKRARTVVARDLTKSMVHVSESASQSTSTALNHDIALEGFLDERSEREDFESNIFSYMFARHKLPNCLLLKDFKTLYAENICINTAPSNIYMELLDKHPDSADTMRHVAKYYCRIIVLFTRMVMLF